MKFSPMRVGMIAVGMVGMGLIISLVAFLCGAKTNVYFVDGEMILGSPFDKIERKYELLEGRSERDNVKHVSNAGYKAIAETIESISKIDIDVDTLDVDIIAGDEFAVDITYRDHTDVFYEVRGEKLTIKQDDFMEWKLFEREGRKGKVIIYLPQEAFIEELDIEIGMGSSEISDIQINKLDLGCGMGSVDMNNVSIGKAYIEGGMGMIKATNIVSNGLDVGMGMGMGNIDIEGDLKGLTEIEGGMGELRLTTKGKETDYNYDLSKGMGSISINGRRHNSFEDLRENNGADNRIVIDGGMGSIVVKTED